MKNTENNTDKHKDLNKGIPEEVGPKEEKPFDAFIGNEGSAQSKPKESSLKQDASPENNKPSVKDFLYKDAFLEGFIWE